MLIAAVSVKHSKCIIYGSVLEAGTIGTTFALHICDRQIIVSRSTPPNTSKPVLLGKPVWKGLSPFFSHIGDPTMPHLRYPYSSIWLSMLTAVCCISTFAQSASSSSTESPPQGTAYFRDGSFSKSPSPDRPNDVRLLGSIRGRVFNDADLSSRPVDSQGIGGVRVILRSGDQGNILRNRISNTNGTFDFPELPPGIYTIELDPLSIPGKFRISNIKVPTVNVEASQIYDVEAPITAKRTISGVVFEDKDGDGQFRPGKDKPIEGASVSINGIFATSNESGRYTLHDLPAGRIGLNVRWPKGNENTQVVIFLDPGPVTNRIVNIPRSR